MLEMTRRNFIEMAASFGAVLACRPSSACMLPSVTFARTAPRPFKSVAVTLAEDAGRPYYDQIVRGVEHGARKVNPQVEFTASSCRNNAEMQMQQIDGFVQSGTNLIIIQRSYEGDSSPAVQRARNAGVTVVAVDVEIPGGTDALIKPDERQGGMLAGRYVARRLNGKGKIAIANGPARFAPIGLRVTGFVDELRKSPGLEIVENKDTGMSRDGSRMAMAGFLARHADLDAVYGVNDPVAYYCELEALAQQRTKLFIVGMEGSPLSVTALRDPQRLIAASPGADPFALAETAAKLGAAIRKGKRKPGETVLMPFIELSRENVGGYRGWIK
jgi:ribose transport system substrate-binding protein